MGGRQPMIDDTQFDVLIVGAGISGIGAACHLKARRPGTTFVILEGRDSIGGTWSLFKYPGFRSDSDMPTFGYSFKPWTHPKAIADGPLILDYLRETVAENGIAAHIWFGYKVLAAEFSATAARWTVTAEHGGTGAQTQLTSRFLFLGTGYYDYESGFTPEFAGVEAFAGPVIHPQHWPEDLDYAGKRVVVIGSGATAVTLIPAMADKTAHVTMLQRSPSYVLTMPAEDVIANVLNKVLGPKRASPIVRRKNILLARGLFKVSDACPGSCVGCSSPLCDSSYPNTSMSTRTSPHATSRGRNGCASCPTGTCSRRSNRDGRPSSPTGSSASPPPASSSSPGRNWPRTSS